MRTGRKLKTRVRDEEGNTLFVLTRFLSSGTCTGPSGAGSRRSTGRRWTGPVGSHWWPTWAEPTDSPSTTRSAGCTGPTWTPRSSNRPTCSVRIRTASPDSVRFCSVMGLISNPKHLFFILIQINVLCLWRPVYTRGRK